MPNDANSRATKLQSSYRKLSHSADALNHASDEFGQAVEVLDRALADLKIGVIGWVTFSESHSEYDGTQATEERIGYDKIGSRKGLAISVVDVDHVNAEESIKQQWLFNEAPRSMRIRAIDAVPELLDHLAKEAASTAERVKESAQVAVELAAAIGGPASGGRQ
jgi:hypothetical protein